MALYDGSGTAVGSGELLPLDGIRIRNSSGLVPGEAVLSASGGLLYLGSARPRGLGTLSVDTTLASSGTGLGTATLSADAERVLTNSSRIIFQGVSRIIQIWPLLVRGGSSLSVSYVVQAVSPVVREIPVFKWRQLFQRGDLALYLCDGPGPIAPVSISYRMFFVRPDGSRVSAGPTVRHPAQGRLGEYYATGYAGEFGQPGGWLIRWTIQRNFNEPVEYVERCFRVEDAVLRNNVSSSSSCGSGWS